MDPKTSDPNLLPSGVLSDAFDRLQRSGPMVNSSPAERTSSDNLLEPSKTAVEELPENLSEEKAVDFSECVSFGLWQVPVILLTFYRGVPAACLMMITNFGAPTMNISCTLPAGKNSVVSKDQCSVLVDGHEQACKSWNYSSDTFTKTMVEEWDLVCDRKVWISTSESIFFCGMLVGNMVLSHISDRFGRRPPILMICVLMAVFGIATTFSPTMEVFAALRFFAAVGAGGIQSLSATIFMETAPKSKRNVFVATYGLGWVAGQLMLVLFAWSLRQWRYIQLASGLSAIPMLIFGWLTPESPRWLMSRGKFDEAEKAVERALRQNRVTDVTAKQIVNGARKQFDVSKRENTKTMSVIDLFRSKSLRTVTFVLTYIYFVHRILYFHLSFDTSLLGGNQFANYATVQSMEIPAKLIGIAIVPLFKRRISLCTCFVVGSAAFALGHFIPSESPWPTVAANGVSMLFMSAAVEVMNIHTTEIYPTLLRTIGMGIVYTISRVGAMVAPFVANLDSYLPSGVMVGIVCGIEVLAGLLYFLTPETFNKVLTDAQKSNHDSDTSNDSPEG